MISLNLHMAHMCLEVNLHPIYYCVLGPFSCPLTAGGLFLLFLLLNVLQWK